MARNPPYKDFSPGLIISALAISAVIFFAGVFVGYGFNREKLSIIEMSMGDVVKDVQSFQLQFLFLEVLGENASCPLLEATMARMNKNSYEIGNKLTSYGADGEVISEEEYTRTKLEYTRLLTSYWLLAKKLKAACQTDIGTVVYFYSKECERCDDQAFVLTYLKNKYGDGVLIFTLDAELDEPSVRTIKGYYNITEYPALIVNGKSYQGFVPQGQLEGLLGLGGAG